jgi:hypothetical protein
MAILMAAVAASFAGAASAEERPDQVPGERVLGLGATLGHDRLSAIAWAEKVELLRLKLPHIDDARAATERSKYFGYGVLDRKVLPTELARKVSALLLDPTFYRASGIARPRPPGMEGRGMGRGCSFVPLVALRFTAADGRSEDVLVCFNCEEADLYPVGHDPRRAPQVFRHGDSAVLEWITCEGADRLARLVAEALPADAGVKDMLAIRERKHRPPDLPKGVTIRDDGSETTWGEVHTLRPSPDGRFVQVQFGLLGHLMNVDVIGACKYLSGPGAPMLVRDVRREGPKVHATIGKHCGADLSLANFSVTCSGCD